MQGRRDGRRKRPGPGGGRQQAPRGFEHGAVTALRPCTHSRLDDGYGSWGPGRCQPALKELRVY